MWLCPLKLCSGGQFGDPWTFDKEDAAHSALRDMAQRFSKGAVSAKEGGSSVGRKDVLRRWL